MSAHISVHMSFHLPVYDPCCIHLASMLHPCCIHAASMLHPCCIYVASHRVPVLMRAQNAPSGHSLGSAVARRPNTCRRTVARVAATVAAVGRTSAFSSSFDSAIALVRQSRMGMPQERSHSSTRVSQVYSSPLPRCRACMSRSTGLAGLVQD